MTTKELELIEQLRQSPKAVSVVGRSSGNVKGSDKNRADLIKMVNEFTIEHYNKNGQPVFEEDRIVVPTAEKYCYNVKRKHTGNHQYIVISITGSDQRCHSKQCQGYRFHPIKRGDNEQLELIINEHLNCDKERVITEGTNYIKDSMDPYAEPLTYDEQTREFYTAASPNHTHNPLLAMIKGGCQKCRMTHRLNQSQYNFTCEDCKTGFNQMITRPEFLQTLSNFYLNITVNNNFAAPEDNTLCHYTLDSESGSFEYTELCNLIIRGHPGDKIAQLLLLLKNNHVFCRDESIYYFFNGHMWEQDSDHIMLRQSIMGLQDFFKKIQQYYIGKTDSKSTSIVKNLDSLNLKLVKVSHQQEIFTLAKGLYLDPKFNKRLNSKKHLVPFTNGAFNLQTQIFGESKREDYITLTTGYDLDTSVRNEETVTFINRVLPEPSVRDYVMKKFAECLNGDIPNTNFLMFIGNGANGKSQLLNLMRETMGEFAEKVEVTLLTRKRSDANGVSPEKAKMRNKRFVYLSEPEDKERINIGLLKELTGSEEIVSRGLYQESVTFRMEAKLFLACNELPDIKGEDNALWRRIKVVNFPSRFVDNPSGQNEYAIDTSIVTKIREDVTWRQTFMNLLLEYYDRVIPEPEAVRIRTGEYRSGNDIVMEFVTEYCTIDLKRDDYRASSHGLYEAFRNYAVENGNGVVSQRHFDGRVEGIMGVKKKKMRIQGRSAINGWTGILLNDSGGVANVANY